MKITPATAAHRDVWRGLRHQLWPENAPEELGAEIDAALTTDKQTAFLAFDDKDRAVGFLEASLRFDHVNGCEGSPVAFLEGIFVVAGCRRQGVARVLIAAFEEWAREKGVREMASDADIGNVVSHAMHEALGFAETERVVYFRKPVA